MSSKNSKFSHTLTIIEAIGCQDANSRRQLEADVKGASEVCRCQLRQVQRASLHGTHLMSLESSFKDIGDGDAFNQTYRCSHR